MGVPLDRLSSLYIGALSLAPVHIVVGDGRVRLVALTKSPKQAITTWCLSELWALELEHRAREILIRRHRDLGGGWIGCRPDVAQSAIGEAASQHGITCLTVDRIADLAEDAMSKVELEFTRLQAAGELRAMNRSYREYRLACNADGTKAMTYPNWIAQRKVRMFRTVVEASRYRFRESA